MIRSSLLFTIVNRAVRNHLLRKVGRTEMRCVLAAGSVCLAGGLYVAASHITSALAYAPVPDFSVAAPPPKTPTRPSPEIIAPPPAGPLGPSPEIITPPAPAPEPRNFNLLVTARGAAVIWRTRS